MPSPDFINYSVRSNKNIERKLIVEALRTLQSAFSLRTYQYIGFGSYWFVDFRLVHSVIGIVDMYSIEKYAPSRARFNTPFRSVTVADGESTVVLPMLPIRERQSLIWLDYDSDLRGPAIADLKLTLERVPTGSIVIVTLNADIRQLRGRKNAAGDPLTEEQALEVDAGLLMPWPLEKDAVTKAGFPATVTRVAQAAARHGLASAGRAEDFRTLFSFKYSDGSPMVTLGGIVADETVSESLESSGIYDLGFTQRDILPLTTIDVPPLTTKEKTAIDGLLPVIDQLTVEDLTRQYGFALKDAQLAAYIRYYKHYPVFGEFVSQ